MRCNRCGESYRVEEAKMIFNDHFNGLDYSSEIDGHLCPGCAIQEMDNRIRSQEGYEEPELY